MTTSETPTPDATEFEARARALLAAYAEEAPASGQAEARVRARLAEPQASVRGPLTRWRAPSPPRGGGWRRAAVSLGLVAALILGFVGVAWLRARTQGAGNQCTEIRITQSDGGSHLNHTCPAGNFRVSLAVAQSYADPTRTAVQIRIATPGALIPHGVPIAYSRPDSLLLRATLTDAQGHVYTMTTGSIPNGEFAYGKSGADLETGTGVVIFDPLPEDALTAPQTLTLRVTGLELYSGELSWLSPVNGAWTTTFQVTPHAGTSIAFHIAPQTHNGVTLQPLRLDFGPDASPFDGFGSGQRLILRVSGLPATANDLAVAGFATTFTNPDGSGGSTGGRSNLRIDDQPPAAVGGVVWDEATGNGSQVGPSGALTLEVIFLGPSLPLTPALTTSLSLSVDRIMTSFGAATPDIPGPWNFVLPISLAR